MDGAPSVVPRPLRPPAAPQCGDGGPRTCPTPSPVPSLSPSSLKSALLSHFRVKSCEDSDQRGAWNGQVCVSEQLPAAWRPLWGRPRQDTASRD